MVILSGICFSHLFPSKIAICKQILVLNRSQHKFVAVEISQDLVAEAGIQLLDAKTMPAASVVSTKVTFAFENMLQRWGHTCEKGGKAN